jgi:signal transduction histidine kinase
VKFRVRILLGLLGVAVIPLAGIGVAVRSRVGDAIALQYEQRVTALVTVIRHDIERQNRRIAERLDAVTETLAGDNRFRQGLRQGPMEDPYVLDYAEMAMRQSGLDLLQVQTAEGRILSSGHFRNEYDLLEPALPTLLARVAGGLAIVTARRPEATFLALARVDSVRVGTRMLWVVGGIEVDRQFLDGLGAGDAISVTILLPDGGVGDSTTSSPDTAVVRRSTVPFVRSAIGGEGEVGTAGIVVSHSLAPLQAVRRSLDIWFVVALGGAALVAVITAAGLSRRISRPLATLAEQSARIDLERLDVTFATDRSDEVGALARVLDAMAARLRASVRTLRDVERRAAVGDLARQVNHDIKNGLVPIRNVFRHLSDVARTDPDRLAEILRERESTVQSAVEYLERLSTTYASLYPTVEPALLDASAAVGVALRSSVVPDQVVLEVVLAHRLPPIRSDEVALRRILENLVTNAIDSLPPEGGRVRIGTELVSDARGHSVVRLVIADTGRGMTAEELDRAFTDFYTTKDRGTGLGLSIVRRLVNDLGGTLRVQTAPGEGTEFVIDFPVEGGDA